MMPLGVDLATVVHRRSVGAMDEEEGPVSLGTCSRVSVLLGGWTSCLVESAIGEKGDRRLYLPARTEHAERISKSPSFELKQKRQLV